MLYSKNLIELNQSFNDNIYKMINMNNDTIRSLINLVVQKNLFHENNITPNFQNSVGQMSFLQKKRFLENENLNSNNLFSFQKDTNTNFFMPTNNNIQLNQYLQDNRAKLDFDSYLMRPKLFYYNNIYNFKKPELNNCSFNYLIPKTKENKIENNFYITTNINNVFNNLNGNQNNDFLLSKYKNIENCKENFNENINENINSTDTSNSAHLLNNTSLIKKNNYFNVTHIKNEKPKKKPNKKIISQSENNNEIKVLKNNKVVYVNTFLLNSYSTSKNIKKLNKIAFIGRNKRSSQYRGVSKNGNQWQVLMMIHKNKSYIGSYPSEELAARIYDILALKNRGIKARTNFIYNSQQIKNICETEIDIKAENINEIISQLIK